MEERFECVYDALELLALEVADLPLDVTI